MVPWGIVATVDPADGTVSPEPATELTVNPSPKSEVPEVSGRVFVKGCGPVTTSSAALMLSALSKVAVPANCTFPPTGIDVGVTVNATEAPLTPAGRTK
jgi:hypothetical protein